MTPESWQRIEAVFGAASALPAAEQRAYVESACGDDASVHAEVLALLDSVEGSSAVLADVIGDATRGLLAESGPLQTGARLGAYEIIAPIGQGGMGTVYLAERADAEFEQRVAIKVLQHGPDAARFRDERQILAQLAHPGIVKLLDGGSTDDNLPYLVMEHVVGEPITTFAKRLDVRARLVLFRNVCAAVQYAHQRLIVHRDLKPSNILVDAGGAPHLLDFGIAKLLDPTAAESREAETRTGMLLLTPEYASPEHARGETVSVATDVYSLGALLYELLADAPALRTEARGLELLRMICEVDPPRPSTVAPAERRRAVAGDLDNIVGKAMHKDPALRYPSVQALDDDLARHLDGRPVLARDATWRYRAGKLVRRHAGAILLAVLVAVALTGLALVSLYQAHRADEQAQRAARRFHEVEKLAHALVFELDDKIRDLPGSTAARELVVTSALEYLDRLAGEAGDDRDLGLELASAYMKIGDIQGNTLVPNLGRPDDGLANYAKAAAILDRLAHAGSADPRLEAAQVAEHYGEGFLRYSRGDIPTAERILAAANAAREALPPGALDELLVLRGFSARTELAVIGGDLANATSHATELIAEADRWGAGNRAEGGYWSSIGHELRGWASVRGGDLEGARTDLRAADAQLDAVVAAEPNNAAYARERYLVEMTLTSTFSRYDANNQMWLVSDVDAGDEFLQTSEHATKLVEQYLAQNPGDSRAPNELADILTIRGATLADRAPADGLPLLDRALALWATLAPSVRDANYVRQFEWFGRAIRARTLARLGRRTEALADISAAIALVDGLGTEAIDKQRLQVQFLAGQVHATLGDTNDALALFDRVDAALAPTITARSFDIGNYLGTVDVLTAIEPLRPADRCVLRARAVTAWRAWPGRSTPFIARALDDAVQRADACSK